MIEYGLEFVGKLSVKSKVFACGCAREEALLSIHAKPSSGTPIGMTYPRQALNAKVERIAIVSFTFKKNSERKIEVADQGVHVAPLPVELLVLEVDALNPFPAWSKGFVPELSSSG
jgi:hypothetical protein